MVVALKQVYTGLLWAVNANTIVSADPHVQENGAELWTPQGDITIIGTKLYACVNPLPNTKMEITHYAYVYAELSLVARENEDRSTLIQTRSNITPVELPTLGEHQLFGDPRYSHEQIVYPAGYGIDMDRWHPVYLNFGYRAAFTSGGFEMAVGGMVYYVER